MNAALTPTPLVSSPLSVEARDDLVDDVLEALSALAPAQRVSLIEGVIAALAEEPPHCILSHRARRDFWNACSALAHLEAGDDNSPAAAMAPGRKSSRAEMLRHFERRAWSAATVLPIRSPGDLFPPALAHLAGSFMAPPRTSPAPSH